jgi:hypothetical protein
MQIWFVRISQPAGRIDSIKHNYKVINLIKENACIHVLPQYIDVEQNILQFENLEKAG